MTTTKTCPVCGIEFTDPKHPNRIYCSRDCFFITERRRIDKTCLECGKVFAVKEAHTHRRFCSQTCSNRYNQPKDPNKQAIFTCKWCGKHFETWVYRKPTFCSSQCRSEYAARQPKLTARKPEIHITRQCVVCGKDYQTTTHQVRLRGSSCCSRECAGALQSKHKQGAGNPNYRGGTVKYRGANWGSQKRKALNRDGFRCQICGKKLGRKGWDYGVHHIKPYREFKGDYETANHLLNLVTLCRRCHGKVEAGKLDCPRPLL